ncbi:hypothetical protein HYV83_05550 [Candidatus Woesearchaeota archaeon]|nr:hypothetical protein [Candidatus Woesearchaeota archaeon]
MFKLKSKGKKGEEQYGDHHQVIVELTPVVLGVVIVLILGMLVFLLVQHVQIMKQVAELAAGL